MAEFEDMQGFNKSPLALSPTTTRPTRFGRSQGSNDIDVQIQQGILSDYERDIEEFGDLEKQLLSEKVDTVDESAAAAAAANERAGARARRERSRYGVQLTPAEMQAEQSLLNIQSSANIATASNLARRSDEALNFSRLRLADQIGRALQGTALSNLLGFSQNQINKKKAFEGARYRQKSSQYGFLGNVGSSLAKLI